MLREYVLPELKADVLAVWFTEPDGSQHEHGAGSPEALAELGNSDRDFGLLLDALAKRFPGRPINVMITSDHGFARHGKAVNHHQGARRREAQIVGCVGRCDRGEQQAVGAAAREEPRRRRRSGRSSNSCRRRKMSM